MLNRSIYKITLRMFLLFGAFSSLYSQHNFIDTLLIPNSSSTWINEIEIIDDKYIIHGNSFHDSINKWCQYIGELDSNGKLNWYSTFCDSTAYSSIVALPPNSFARDSISGRFYFHANYIESKDLIFYVLDSLGQYLNSIVLEINGQSIFPKRIIFKNNSIYLFGDIQRDNYKFDNYIMNLDTNGQIAWTKYYGNYQLDNLFGDLVINPNNTFTIYGNESNYWIEIPPNQRYNKPWLLTVDMDGNITNQWRGEEDDNRFRGHGSLYILPDGDMILTSIELKDVILNNISYTFQAPIITRITPTYKLIWKKYLGAFTSTLDFFIDLEFDTSSGNFVAAGHRVHYYSDEYQELQPWAVKFTDIGEILWSVSDTIFADAIYDVKHFTSDMEVSKSGDIFLVGYLDHNVSPRKYYGWIMKISSDGCIDTLCPPITTYTSLPELDQITVFPNPIEEILHVVNPIINTDLLGTIATLDGKIVYSSIFPSGSSSHNIHLNNGIYILRLFNQTNSFAKKILISK